MNRHKITSPILCIFLYYSLFITAAKSAIPPAIQQGNIYHKGINLDEYLVSEKLDGVRAYWDGENLLSKHGNIINAPKWFTKDFPKEDLEGELWISHGQFELVSSASRKQIPEDKTWQEISLMLFDMPKNPEIFEKRLESIKQIVASRGIKHLKLINHYKLHGHEELMTKLQEITQNGGEGLMLHKAKSHYQAVRNNDILKVKTYQDDEAKVIAHIAGKGKFKGMLGSLLVENRDKIKFKIGTGFNNEQRKNPPKIGSIITYKFYGKNKNNKPKFVSFIRVMEGYVFEYN